MHGITMHGITMHGITMYGNCAGTSMNLLLCGIIIVIKCQYIFKRITDPNVEISASHISPLGNTAVHILWVPPTMLHYCPWSYPFSYLLTLWQVSSGGPPIIDPCSDNDTLQSTVADNPPQILYYNSPKINT